MMHSHLTIRQISDRLNAIVEPVSWDDADRWARMAIVAASIPHDVDLTDEADVIRALFAARFSAADFTDVLSEAIQHAQEARKS